MPERPHQEASISSTSNRHTGNIPTSNASYQPSPAQVAAPAQDSQGQPIKTDSHDGTKIRQLPPLPLPPPAPSRSSSFTNLLNPTRTEDDAPKQRRKASDLDSPPAPAAQLPQYRQRNSPGAPSADGFSLQRRILTPRSPSLHRTASMGQLGGPTGTIDAQQTPFINSPRMRNYTAEPGAAGVPPLPTPRSYPAYTSMGMDRRTSSSTIGNKALSPSVSPRTAYAQQGPIRQSPITTGPLSLSSYHHTSDHEQRISIPISSSAGPNVYQMMAYETSVGTVHLPVDVQGASKQADEKRKRNAGASARFRARRKEKEKESTSTISKLEMTVKELTEDVEFYRRERNYLANVVLQNPSGSAHFPRPASPRLHRRTSIGMQPSISGSSDYMSGQDMPRSPGDSRNVRRRVSDLPMAAPRAPQSQSAGPSNYAQQYESQQYQHAPLPGPASLLLTPSSQPPVMPMANAPMQPPGWTAYNDTRPGPRPER